MFWHHSNPCVLENLTDLKGFVNGWSPSLKKILEDLVLWADSQTTIQLYRAQRLTSKSGQIPTHHHIQKQSDSFVMTCTVCAIQADAVFDLCRSKYSLLTIDLFESLLRTICEACKTQNPWKNVSSPFVCLRCRHNSRLARIVPAEISLIVQLEQGPSSASQAIFALSLGLDSNHSTSSLQTPGQGGTPKTQKINGEYWLETLVPEMARWDSLTSEERLEQFSLFDDAIAVLLKSYTVQLLVYWMDGVLHLKNLVNRK